MKKDAEKKWEESLGRLQEFIAEHGKQPSRYPDGIWLRTQRAMFRQGKLSQKRISALDLAVPKWKENMFVETWQNWMDVLVAYVAANNDRLPPWGAVWESDGREWKIGAWLREQRRAHKKGCLQPERSAVLNAAFPGWEAVQSVKEKYWAQALEEVGWAPRAGEEAQANEVIDWGQALAQVGWI